MPTTVLVEPFPSGHRFHTVAMVAAEVDGDVVLLTSRGATADPAFETFLGDFDGVVEEVFDDVFPSAAQVAAEASARARAGRADTVVVLDADQMLKRWWWDAPRTFGLRRRPRVIFMLTRYPARLRLTDTVGWRLRIPKAAAALLAMSTRSLHRVAGFAGRDDTSPGWLVKRAPDPAVCSAHSRDAAVIRKRHGLPEERTLVGIYGGVSERKHPHLVWDAMQQAGVEADLVLGGNLSEGVAAWLRDLPASSLGTVRTFGGFLPDAVLDELVAASDVVVVAMDNNGPSGIMGKALAAGVRVLTAGSTVRAREVAATGGGVATDLDVAAMAAGLREVLAANDGGRPVAAPLATPQDYARAILGPVTS